MKEQRRDQQKLLFAALFIQCSQKIKADIKKWIMPLLSGIIAAKVELMFRRSHSILVKSLLIKFVFIGPFFGSLSYHSVLFLKKHVHPDSIE